MTDKEPDKLATHGRIKTRCPSCGFDTLFISPSGWLTCSWLKCKDPTAITNAESFAQSRVDEAVKPLVKLLMAAYSVIPYSAILLETGCPLNDEIKKALEEPK